MADSLSIVIPAYNEQENIIDALQSVRISTKPYLPDTEIIIVDDGSTDGTYKIIEDLAKQDKKIRIIHHKVNKGLGISISDGFRAAKNKYVAVFPGDNDMSGKSLTDLVKIRHGADLIICYPDRGQRRSKLRILVSRLFVFGINIIFGLNLRYFNGPFIVKTAFVKNLSLKSVGFFIYAEMKIRLLRKGLTVKEISFKHTGRLHGRSKALSLPTLYKITKDVVRLRVYG